MSDEKFIVENEGTPKLEPVEVKDHSKDVPHMTDEQLKKHAEFEAEATANCVGPMACSPEIYAAVKKANGRPKGSKNKVKKAEPKPSRNWRCATCQEVFDDKSVMKIGAGENRYAVFCPMCQKSLGFEDPVVLDTVAALIKNNPTGKNVKKA